MNFRLFEIEIWFSKFGLENSLDFIVFLFYAPRVSSDRSFPGEYSMLLVALKVLRVCISGFMK